MSARFHRILDIGSLALGAFCVGLVSLNCLFGVGELHAWWQ